MIKMEWLKNLFSLRLITLKDLNILQENTGLCFVYELEQLKELGHRLHLETIIKELMPLSVKEYKEWFNINILPERKNYPFRGTSKPAHLHLENYSNNYELVKRFETFMIEQNWLEKEYVDPNQMIYELNRKADRYVDTFPKGNYTSDISLFGVVDKWMSPTDAHEYYIAKNVAGDCEDKTTFKWCLFVAALKHYGLYEEHVWRLKFFVVDVITGFGHALIGWLKDIEDEVVGWVFVESTFYQDKFKEVWRNNLTFKSNILYKIRFSFDERKEYVKIGRR